MLKKIQKYPYTLVLLVILLAVSIYSRVAELSTFIFLPFNLLTVLSLLVLVGRIRNSIFRIFLLSIVFCFLIFDVNLMLLSGTRNSLELISSFFETNINEIVSMSMFYGFRLALITICFIAVLIKSYLELKSIGFKIKYVNLLFLFSIFAPIIVKFSLSNRYVLSFDSELIKNNFNIQLRQFKFNAFQAVANLTPNPFIVSDVLLGSAFFLEHQRIQGYILASRAMPPQLTSDLVADNGYDRIVLVVGESASSRHMSLYDYPINTTPFMDTLKDSKLLLKYNGISSFLFTRVCVPNILTASNSSGMSDLASTYLNILEVASNNSYETFWLSNQGQIGMYEGPISSIAQTAKHIVYNDNIKDKDDLDLVSLFSDQWLRVASNKALFVVHLQGSHRSFKDKYDNNDILIDSISPDSNVAMYDKSILHTDRFLREIYSLIGPEDVLIYTSDHGEIPGSQLGRYGGVDTYAYDVPLVVMTKNQNSLPSLDNFVSSETNYINNANLYWVVMKLLGYNLLEPNFMKEIINHGDYIALDMNLTKNGEVVKSHINKVKFCCE